MTTTPMPPTPEHDKLRAVHAQSQAIGEFLEWLGFEKQISLMTYVDQTEDVPCTGWLLHGCIEGIDEYGRTCRKCKGSGRETRREQGWRPQPQSIETLLAEHFDIDQKVLEQEKRAILARLS